MPGMSGLETLSEMKEKILRSDDYDHQKWGRIHHGGSDRF
jgi:hypothetical protein